MDTPEPTPPEAIRWSSLPPVVPMYALTARLQAAGMPPAVALLTVALMAVEDVHVALDEREPGVDWEWPMEDFDLEYSKDVGGALNAAADALKVSLAHYHATAARRLLVASASASREGGDR